MQDCRGITIRDGDAVDLAEEPRKSGVVVAAWGPNGKCLVWWRVDTHRPSQQGYGTVWEEDPKDLFVTAMRPRA